MNPSGLCGCGCGAKTRLAPYTSTAMGWIKGRPLRFINGHHQRGHPTEYELDRATGCWNWMWARYSDGYGMAAMPGNTTRQAHRVVYERFRGPIPGGMDLDHLCRNIRCVNPDHLEPVTQAVNTQRGRTAKLTAETVREIRALAGGGLSHREIRRLFGVAGPTVGHVIRRRTWADVV
jgi:hypothetical protein